MPNLVGQLALAEINREIQSMGSCVVVRFDKLTVKQASDLRRRFGAEGITAKVVKNRWSRRAFSESGFEWPALTGKCYLCFAPEERAITCHTEAEAEVKLVAERGIEPRRGRQVDPDVAEERGEVTRELERQEIRVGNLHIELDEIIPKTDPDIVVGNRLDGKYAIKGSEQIEAPRIRPQDIKQPLL